MRRLLPLPLLLLAACGGDRAVVPDRIGYDDPAAWLCLPGGQGRAGGEDACASADLSVDVVDANGQVTRAASAPATDPAADCFYVYPTTSGDSAFNADMVPDDGTETRTVQGQFARFASACRLYAPMYRQQSLAGLRNVFMGGEGGDEEVAYRDVADAFATYLERYNEGRPFVLYGHSQGTVVLKRLIQEEVVGTEAQDRLLGAYLLGLNVMVPTEGSDAEPELDLPPCERAGQTGCLVAFVTYGEDHPPPADALFGRGDREGLRPLCVNPAALLGRDAMGAVLPTAGYGDSIRQSEPWTSAPGQAVTARFVSAPGLIEGRCVTDGPLGYLEVVVSGDAADARADDIGGEIVIFGRPQRNWGLHILDAGVAQDDVIEMVRRQTAGL